MRQPPVDGPTFRDATRAVIRARDEGLDVVEELNRSGLLLTPAQSKTLRLQAMRLIRDELDVWAPHEMLRVAFRPNHPATPADMYEAVKVWVDRHIQAVQEES
jgi:hypothetical protein